MKMPFKDPSRNTSARKAFEPNRCAFETSDGRRCRLPRSSGHPALCVFHSRDEQQLLESRKIGAEISAPITGDFLTATDINFVLGKTLTAVAQNRIPARTGHTLAYIAQLMLFSLPMVKKEFDFKYDFDQWDKMLSDAVRLSDPSPEPALATTYEPQVESQADSQEANGNDIPSES